MSRTDVYWEPAPYGKLLHHPYNEEFLEKLKAEVPDEEHGWRGNGRWVSDAYVREVEILINKFFGE
jgi:hypothetical protein